MSEFLYADEVITVTAINTLIEEDNVLLVRDIEDEQFYLLIGDCDLEEMMMEIKMAFTEPELREHEYFNKIVDKYSMDVNPKYNLKR